MEKKRCVSRGILQPADIIKKKDTFLIKSGFADKLIAEKYDDENIIVIKKYNNDYLASSAGIDLILFPEIGKKFSTQILSKSAALIKLFHTSITPGFSINLKQHFKVLNNLVENSETYSIVLTKDYSAFQNFLDGITLTKPHSRKK